MITLFYYGSRAFSARLPWVRDWSVVIPLVKSSRVALAGNTIRQTVIKDPSGGVAKYSGDAWIEDVDEIIAMQEETTTCTLSDGVHVYEMVFDAREFESQAPGKKSIQIDFEVVRRVL